ncbi:MAG: hypothetical protein HYS13_10660 [Planctomycetia bacterium]|nr:hypothetical protein [Planctomycetia bacterium]
MSKLLDLRSRLAALRRRLWLLRTGAATGLAGVLFAAVVAMAFLLDFSVEPPLLVRGVLLAVVSTALAMALAAVAVAALRRRPTILALAVGVERRNHIDTDLVAALEFETPQAQSWGSPQLQSAVITRAAESGKDLNVFGGLSYRRAAVAGGVFLALVAAAAVSAIVFPDHAAAFVSRLLLGSAHYPTKTRIERLLVNDATVSPSASAPGDLKGPFGKPLTFTVLASGELPPRGRVRLAGADGHDAILDLAPLDVPDRAARLNKALQLVHEVHGELTNPGDATASSDFVLGKVTEVRSLAAADAPDAAAALLPDPSDPLVPPQVGDVERAERLLRAAASQRVYSATLGQLVETVRFDVRLGDAWTDPISIEAIPLPVVDVSLRVTPPEYAHGADSAAGAIPAGARQAAVLEGSRVEILLSSTKPLRSAQVTLGDKTVVECQPAGSDRKSWRLPAGTPLDAVAEAVGYSVHVTDDDGMTMPEPIRGFIRIKADRPPKVFADVVTRHVLPTARPNLWFGAADDFGLAALRVRAWRVRGGAEGPPQVVEVPLVGRPRRIAPLVCSIAAGDDANSTGSPAKALDQLVLPAALRNELTAAGVQLSPGAAVTVQQPGSRWFLSDPQNKHPLLVRQERTALFVYRQFLLDLSALDLALDDEVKLELEARDFRGNQTGKTSKSEVIVLHVTDERGVLAAMVESDQRSAQQLNAIIERQLGIGGSP